MPKITTNPACIKDRFNTLRELYHNDFANRIGTDYAKALYLNDEILHCAVNAYFDDIERFKCYAGSKYASQHKQAAYTIKWISQLKPIQVREGFEMNDFLLVVNPSFALYAGFMFLDPDVPNIITEDFFDHLLYTLTYRRPSGKDIAMVMYLLEEQAKLKRELTGKADK